MFEGRPEKITKEYILDRVSQEDLFEKYLGSGVAYDGELFKSPLRSDRNPTCTVYRNTDLFRFVDYAGPRYNIFDIVMLKNNCNLNDALNIIAQDFKLFRGTTNRGVFTATEGTYLPKKETEIKVIRQKFTEVDKAYWGQYHLKDPQIFERYETISCQYVFWTDKFTGELELKAIYNKNNPIYAYSFRDNHWKIYFPFLTDWRFRCNTDKLQGYNQLDKTGDILVWTKSLKDCMVFRLFGINAVAKQAETNYIKDEVIHDLKSKFKSHLIIYDDDNAGREGAARDSDQWGFPTKFIPFNEGKDISGYVKKHGLIKTGKLIETLLR